MIKVVSIYKEAYPSICLAFDEPLRYLAEKNIIEYRCVKGWESDSSVLNWGDYFFFGRSAYGYELALIRKIREAGKCAVYMLDDDLLAIPPDLNCPDYCRSEDYLRGIRECIENSRCFASPSEKLIEKYGKNKDVILLEEPILNPVEFVRHEGYPVKIGFAGSLTRTSDVNRILSEVLIRIKEKYRDKVVFEFMGARPDFIGDVDGVFYPYEKDYRKYLARLNSLKWDIGLAPLPDTPFHNCKHYIKFIEYSSMGTVSVMSDVEPYNRLRKNNMPAILCPNTEEGWESALSKLIDDYDELQNMRYDAYQKGNSEYSLEKCANLLLSQLEKYGNDGETRRIHYLFPRARYFISLLSFYLKNAGLFKTFRKCFVNILGRTD